MAAGKRLTDRDKSIIVQMYNDGSDYRAIVSRLNVDRSVIGKVLSDARRLHPGSVTRPPSQGNTRTMVRVRS